MPREVGDWTQDKLKILASYLVGYLGATTKAKERVYIDAFAGPGTNRLRTSRAIIDGSPLIALKARARNGTKFDRLFFIEQDPNCLAELEAAASADGRVTVVEGDVNRRLASVLEKVPRRSPTFVFIDPVGIEPAWSTIAELADWRTELFINFPFGMSINRNPSSAKVLQYFGTKECERFLKLSGSSKVRGLLDLYKTRLSDLGYVHQPRHERLVKTNANRRLYYLLLASKSDVAPKIMNWVFAQPDARGSSSSWIEESRPRFGRRVFVRRPSSPPGGRFHRTRPTA